MNSRPGSVLTTLSSTLSFQKQKQQETLEHGDTNIKKYNTDWTKQYHGYSSIVVRPQTTEEVYKVVQYCQENKLGIVPQGGNTGLCGGSVSLSTQEIVLSLEKMNQIHHNSCSDGTTNIVRADAGCILQDVQDYAANHMQCIIPIDLGAKGTCQIGGNLSTNAGGVYYYRYGSLHANCVGLEVVVPTSHCNNSDGGGAEILNLGYHPVSHLKDNTGYDLKHLFVGAEGTLGVITKVALLCPPLPLSIGAVWLTVKSIRDVLQILTLARTKYLNEILAAFEFMDLPVLDLIKSTHGPSVKFPVESSMDENYDDPYYSILIETHGSNEGHDQEKLSAFLEGILEGGLVVDGVVAQNLDQIQDFWKIRESCNPAAAATGYVYKYDLSLAPTDFDGFIHEIKTRLKYAQQTSDDRDIVCVNWGHIIGN
jgi:FAD/FMN-containing dehydrogenase